MKEQWKSRPILIGIQLEGGLITTTFQVQEFLRLKAPTMINGYGMIILEAVLPFPSNRARC